LSVGTERHSKTSSPYTENTSAITSWISACTLGSVGMNTEPTAYTSGRSASTTSRKKSSGRDHDAGAVARVLLGARRTAVFEVLEQFDGVGHRSVARIAVEINDSADPAVRTLVRYCRKPPPWPEILLRYPGVTTWLGHATHSGSVT